MCEKGLLKLFWFRLLLRIRCSPFPPTEPSRDLRPTSRLGCCLCEDLVFELEAEGTDRLLLTKSGLHTSIRLHMAPNRRARTRRDDNYQRGGGAAPTPTTVEKHPWLAQELLKATNMNYDMCGKMARALNAD